MGRGGGPGDFVAQSASIRRQSEPFGLGWALALSGLLHLLLLLISGWVPLELSAADAAESLEETTIEFSFLTPSETDTDERASDFPPAPTPPQPATVPDVVPPGEADAELAPDQLVLPPEASPDPLPEPMEPEQAPPEDEPPRPEAPVEDEVVGEPEQPIGEASVDLPPDRAAESRRGSEAPAQVEPERPRLDMSQALRDFGRSSARRSSGSRPPQRSGGKPSNVFVPDLSSLPTTGFGMGNLRFESTDFDWSDYGRQIYMAIWRAWHNRLYVTTNDFDKWSHEVRSWYLNHAVAVRFVIERSGQVTGIVIEARSGCLPLDASAVDALEEVLLPPLPAAFPRDRETVHARFITRGDVRTMKQILAQYKQLGLF
jgi:outer membrane biosynthesis protein TonB